MGQSCGKMIRRSSVAATMEADVSCRGSASHYRVRYSVITRMNLLLCVEEGNGPIRSYPTNSNGLKTSIGCNLLTLRWPSLTC